MKLLGGLRPLFATSGLGPLVGELMSGRWSDALVDYVEQVQVLGGRVIDLTSRIHSSGRVGVVRLPHARGTGRDTW